MHASTLLTKSYIIAAEGVLASPSVVEDQTSGFALTGAGLIAHLDAVLQRPVRQLISSVNYIIRN